MNAGVVVLIISMLTFLWVWLFNLPKAVGFKVRRKIGFLRIQVEYLQYGNWLIFLSLTAGILNFGLTRGEDYLFFFLSYVILVIAYLKRINFKVTRLTNLD
jgi:hypothetical protein